jgi:uncharacterized protein (TIGR02246 family)
MFLLAVSVQAADAKPRPSKIAAGKSDRKPAGNPDEAAIRATAKAFVEAFNRGDAKSLAALWTANGSLSDETGRVLVGRKAIEAEYAALFKQLGGAKIDVNLQSIQFPAPNVAIEDGTAQAVAKDGGAPAATRYTAFHVREDGKWRMAAVRESSVEIVSNFPRLQALQWLIGKWEAKKDGVAVLSEFRWVANRSFIQREYTTRHDGVVTASGLQIIGFDPQAGRLRSWSFDSSGGHGSGVWSPTPEGWLIESSGQLADGTPTSSKELLIRVPGEESVFGWRSFDRKVGDVELADTAEVVLDRIPEKK